MTKQTAKQSQPATDWRSSNGKQMAPKLGSSSAALPTVGYVRLPHIIGNSKVDPPIPAIIPVSKSTWWAGVRSGRFPKPVRTLGARIAAWRVEDIRALIAESV